MIIMTHMWLLWHGERRTDMDINFHYFAVKTIATYAGFAPADAQIIAAYSQFIDDFTMMNNIYFYYGVPDYAKHLVRKGKVYDEFVTITTGFASYIEMARLAIWKYQRQICVPFHFIPKEPIPQSLTEKDDTSKYCTHAAIYNGNLLVNNLLRNAAVKYSDSLSRGERERKNALMRIGMVMHIFADTYAHDCFSGFWGWENYSYLDSATRVTDRSDITGNYSRDTVATLPSIGHANVSHAPDDTFAYIKIRVAKNASEKSKDQYSLTRSRSNLQWFCDAAKEIYKYLCVLTEKPTEKIDRDWPELHSRLVKGFELEGVKIGYLTEGWSMIAPGIVYSYNKDDYGNNLLHGGFGEENADISEEAQTEEEMQMIPGISFYKYADDDFFYYNIIAKEIRDMVIGDEL